MSVNVPNGCRPGQAAGAVRFRNLLRRFGAMLSIIGTPQAQRNVAVAYTTASA